MVYTSPDVVDLYSRYNVLSRQELKARQEIYIEQYCKTIRAEANLVIRMGRTIIYPPGCASSRNCSVPASTCAP